MCSSIKMPCHNLLLGQRIYLEKVERFLSMATLFFPDEKMPSFHDQTDPKQGSFKRKFMIYV